MSIYTPNRWVILKIEHDGEIIHKVFSGNYGGYGGSDTWKLNSGNVTEEEFEDRWEFAGYTGSKYICYKHCYGMSNYMYSIYSSWNKFTPENSFTIMDEYDVHV